MLSKDELTTLILILDDEIKRTPVLNFSTAARKVELERILQKFEYLADES